MKRWLNAADAAEKLGYRSRSAFYKAVARHGIPHVRIGNVLRFSDAKLDAFMEMLARASSDWIDSALDEVLVKTPVLAK